ncbi:unnamed protein product [Chrysoparadoxa australica]
MTLGVDVSRLFTEMVMAIETRDVVIKKMVYLYLCTYAHAEPDLAVMCINTLQRDCSNEDPMVRGLALRSLCSLRLPSIVEYISEPLRKSLRDTNAYVRKTGVMGILKLFHLQPEVVRESNMIDTLYSMIQDPDALVVCNCITVLDEIMADEGGMAINRAIVLHLLGKMSSFNEWGVCHVLALVCRYKPFDEDEAYSIMNLLDPALRTTNSAVVFSVIECFLHLTKAMGDDGDAKELQVQVLERAAAPLLTLMAGSGPELVHCILMHIEVLVQQHPAAFEAEYRQFYTRANDPTNVKYAKIALLSQVANGDSMTEVINELTEYVRDTDSELVRRAIQAMANLSQRLPEGTDDIIEHFIDFLDVEESVVRAQTILSLQTLLRKYAHFRPSVLPHLGKCLRSLDSPEAKSAVIWMIGEYGQDMVKAPYILEPLIDSWDEQTSVLIKAQLLSACMKLFFKRPPEIQSMLGRLLAAALNDDASQDLHDRALLYYRLLKEDVVKAEVVILGEGSQGQTVLGAFAEEQLTSVRDAIFDEFNTLSVMYGETGENFTKPKYRVKEFNEGASQGGADALARGLKAMGILDAPVPAAAAAPSSLAPAQPPAASALPVVDLLGLMDDTAPPPAEPANSLQPPSAPPLKKDFSIDSAGFQTMWRDLNGSTQHSFTVTSLPSSTSTVEAAAAKHNIFTMASGDKTLVMKFFFYASSGSDTHLVQCSLDKATHALEVVVKTTAGGGEAKAISSSLAEKIHGAVATA